MKTKAEIKKIILDELTELGYYREYHKQKGQDTNASHVATKITHLNKLAGRMGINPDETTSALIKGVETLLKDMEQK